MGQQVLDIELWLAEVLRGPLNQHQLQQYFLSDYAVHVSDVSGHHHHTPPHTSTATKLTPSLPQHYPTLPIGVPAHRDGWSGLGGLGVILGWRQNSWVRPRHPGYVVVM